MVNKKIIQKKLLFLLKDLVKIDTSYPPGNSYKFDQYIRKYLKLMHNFACHMRALYCKSLNSIYPKN